MKGELNAENENPVMISTKESMDILSGFLNEKNPPSPKKVTEMTKEIAKAEDNWRGTDEISKLPEYEHEKGFKWLASKYGKFYELAISKVKKLTKEGRSSFKTEKEYRDFVHLDFDAYGIDYKEFFKDVLFADTQLYFYLQKNANKSRAPSYTSSAREFREWLKKH